VNSKGEFNVPFGRYKDPIIVNEERIQRGSRLLSNVDVLSQDFNYILDAVNEGDVCYLDPPYSPVSKTAKFTDYSEGGFSKSDQVRLRDVCINLDERGVYFIQSNSNTKIIRELYSNQKFRIEPLRTNRNISSKVSSRTSGYELLITNQFD
jgi:DNA adenine methylase